MDLNNSLYVHYTTKGYPINFDKDNWTIVKDTFLI